MQEQMKTGFNHISREIRSLSSSVQPQITLGKKIHLKILDKIVMIDE
jgi:hypothetical protein